MGDALAGLPIVIANSGIEGKEYTDEYSDYERLMRDDTFWKREDLTKTEITNHMPMRHRECTLKRFALLKPGESLKTLFDRYTDEYPDSYEFVGGPYIVPHIDRTVQDKYEQIGDAVPPLLAYAWGEQINRLFEINEK